MPPMYNCIGQSSFMQSDRVVTRSLAVQLVTVRLVSRVLLGTPSAISRIRLRLRPRSLMRGQTRQKHIGVRRPEGGVVLPHLRQHHS